MDKIKKTLLEEFKQTGFRIMVNWCSFKNTKDKMDMFFVAILYEDYTIYLELIQQRKIKLREKEEINNE